MRGIPSPVVLVVIDGWGARLETTGNAYLQANKPKLTKLFAAYPNSVLLSSEESVGLPKGQAGNSEVGHLNLGAGRIVYQELLRINRSIADGSFWSNSALVAVTNHVLENKSNLHLIGLVSPGGVHSFAEHLYALLWFCRNCALPKNRVKIHFIADGRDTPPKSAALFLQELLEKINQIGVGEIATVVGRYYAMDRDNRWERTELAYKALVEGKGPKAQDPKLVIEKSYQERVSDEFIIPTVIVSKNREPVGVISDGDGVIFSNFRGDRARQLTKAFVLPEFRQITAQKSPVAGHEVLASLGISKRQTLVETFERRKFLKKLFFVTLTEYEKNLPVTAVAFPPEEVDLPLARILSESNLRQFHLAETEKYPHVTYFFNGGREDPFPGEDRMMAPSPKVATYDLKPQMSAQEITDVLLGRIENQVYHFIIVNFANFDMVAHTGNFPATLKAVETVDACVGKIVSQVLAVGGVAIITSDHGNIEEMINPQTGKIDTEHNKNPVPIVICWEKLRGKRNLQSGILADVAPTILDILKLPKPSVMTGISLLD